MLYPSDGEFLNEGMRVWANLSKRRHSERKKGVVSGEQSPILVALRLAYVRKVFFCMPRCIFQIGAGAKVSDGNIEYKHLILASGATDEE